MATEVSSEIQEKIVQYVCARIRESTGERVLGRLLLPVFLPKSWGKKEDDITNNIFILLGSLQGVFIFIISFDPHKGPVINTGIAILQIRT